METLGERLMSLRKKKHLSINQVAKSIGVSPSTYRAWEYGVSIKGEPYVILAKVFEVTVGELLTGERSMLEIHLDEVEKRIKEIRSLI